ncbi:metal ABC transporter solute-binding protein, Zn/Mn family [Clostridium oceanicum]|uniref:Metal ABC transporter substrate-binding protein n=1 Tax=Clostridium oceanicum TaxID=1543 RepID=A0ABP3UQF6_9CLOT
MKKSIAIFAIIVSFLTFTACSKEKNANSSNVEKNSKIQVVVSFSPLENLVRYIGGDKVEIKTLIPTGSEPHEFEPKLKDMKLLNESKLFIYNGLGIENWVDKTLGNINKDSLEVVNSSKSIKPIKIAEKGDANHGKYDPHIWLSLKSAIKQSENIKEGLVKVDSSNKKFYEENFKKFKEKAEKLYGTYREKLSECKNKNFVTGHAAFGYLCRDFNLKQSSVEDVFQEGEPTPKKIKGLVDYCKRYNIKTIFYEENVSPKVSNTLAKEVGGKIKKIDTMEVNKKDKDYFDIMESNLEKIYLSLK